MSLLALILEMLADLGLPTPRWVLRHERIVWIVLITLLAPLFLGAFWRFVFVSPPPGSYLIPATGRRPLCQPSHAIAISSAAITTIAEMRETCESTASVVLDNPAKTSPTT